MKRLLMFLLVSMFSVSLAGCEFLPDEVVDEVNKELIENVSEDQVLDQVEAFLRAYTNPDVSKEEVCNIWTDGLDDDCDGMIEEARVKFKAGADLSKTVQINDYDLDADGDGLGDVEVAYDFGGHITVLKLRVQTSILNEEPSLTIVSFDVTHELKEEVLTMVNAFVADFSDDALSNDEVCRIWTDKIDDDCDGMVDEARVKFKTGAELSKSIAITNPDLDGDGWLDVGVSYEFRGHVTVLKIAVQTEDSESRPSIQVMVKGVETILQENTQEEFDAFISALKDETISSGEVCRIWTDGIDDDCDGMVDEARVKFKAGAELSKTVYGGDPDSDDDGLFDAIVEVKTDDAVTCMDLSFKEVLTGDTRSIVFTKVALFDGGGDCDDGDRDVYPGEVSKVIGDFFTAYNDASVTREDLSVFFGMDLTEEYMLMRQRFLSSGAEVVFVDLIGPVDLNTYILVYDILTADGASRQDERMTVGHRIDKATPVLFTELIHGHDDDDDGDGILTAEEIEFVQAFEGALMDATRPLEEVCKEYLGNMDSCPVLEDGEQVEEVQLIESGAGILFRIKKRPDLLTSEWDYITDTYHAYLYEDLDGRRVLDLVPTIDFSYEEEVSRQFQEFLDGLANEAMSIDEVCTFVSNQGQIYCADLREQLLNMHPMIVGSKTVYLDNQEFVELSVSYGDSSDGRLVFRVNISRNQETLKQVLDFTIVE